MKIRKNGFTLLELLIVIAIIIIIFNLIFIALDPITRFKDSRDSVRWQDASTIYHAIKIHQIDNDGFYLTAVSSTSAGLVYMIGTGHSGCSSRNGDCDTNVESDAACIDLSGLVTDGYLGDIPISPRGNETWSSVYTGYTLQRDSSGIIYIRACESENSGEIEISG